MTWAFDQAPNVVCVTNKAVMDGAPVLVATHYEEDHSWAFLDGGPFEFRNALLVGMGEVLKIHPELQSIASLRPGWSASRLAKDGPWTQVQDHFGDEVSQ